MTLHCEFLLLPSVSLDLHLMTIIQHLIKLPNGLIFRLLKKMAGFCQPPSIVNIWPLSEI